MNAALRLRFDTLDVFTDRPYCGNPLAVVHDADALGTRQMQALAREFNLSETVFLLRPQHPGSAARLRIFTPARELPFAGHPTVGTACLLAELGAVAEDQDQTLVLEEGIGPVRVRVRRRQGEAPYAELTAAQPPALRAARASCESIAAALGLDVGDLGAGGQMPRVGDAGLPVLLVPLRSPELLAAIDPDFAGWMRRTTRDDPDDLYVYVFGYEGELRARMFGPGVGVAEDPATGAAAAALAGVLALESPADQGPLRWTLHQGVEMGRASLIHLEADKRDGRVTAVRVGGQAVRISSGEIHAS